MNTFDLLIIAIVAALAALGYAQGFIVGAASLAGLVLGGVVGTRVTQGLLERGSDGAPASAWAPFIGLCVGLFITVIGAMAMQDIGATLRHRLGTDEHLAIDHVLGALLLAIVGLLLAWFTAASTIGVPQLRELRPQIVESKIVTQLNNFLPDAAPIVGALASYDPFPKFDGGRINIDAPDPQLPKDPEVADASRSVVRVIGSACGYRITGSGWVGAEHYVVTNAHVVAGQSDTAVQIAGQGEVYQADVVGFDSVNDLAVLRVPRLDLTPLVVVKPAQGASGVVLGYPENRGFQSTAARFDDERRVLGEDIYGEGSVERRVSSFRGLVRHGNSGGPLVDGAGRVLSTVFASTIGKSVEGGYGVPNDLAVAALEKARRVPDGFGVRTGPCIA